MVNGAHRRLNLHRARRTFRVQAPTGDWAQSVPNNVQDCLSLGKLKLRHLSLVGRVTVANALIMSFIWYFITLWAGHLDFFSPICCRVKLRILSGLVKGGR